MTSTMTLFQQLPDNLRSKIYEYDNTYKDIMKDVLVDVWRESWFKTYRKTQDPNIALVLKHLFMGWGVFYDYLLFSESPKTNILPDDVKIIYNLNNKGFISISVFIIVNGELENLLTGCIVNREQENQEFWDDFTYITNIMFVCSDDRHGLSLYV